MRETGLSLSRATEEKLNPDGLSVCGYYRDHSGKFVHISCPKSLLGKFLELTGLSPENDASAVPSEEDIAAWVLPQEGSAVVSLLENAGIGAAVVKDYKDIIADPHAKASGAFVELDVPYVGKASYPAVPFSLSDSPLEYGKIPKIGEDNYEVLHRFLGMDEETVKKLTEEGVLYQGEHARWK